MAILGHNGSGKSTFAKQINGILSPTDGTLFVSEMDTRDEAHLWDIRKNAGMVFQNPDNQIIGNIVEEDVGFGPENIGVPTEEIWERVDRELKGSRDDDVPQAVTRTICPADRSSVWRSRASWR